jgi:hypothetical protein
VFKEQNEHSVTEVEGVWSRWSEAKGAFKRSEDCGKEFGFTPSAVESP